MQRAAKYLAAALVLAVTGYVIAFYGFSATFEQALEQSRPYQSSAHRPRMPANGIGF